MQKLKAAEIQMTMVRWSKTRTSLTTKTSRTVLNVCPCESSQSIHAFVVSDKKEQNGNWLADTVSHRWEGWTTDVLLRAFVITLRLWVSLRKKHSLSVSQKWWRLRSDEEQYWCCTTVGLLSAQHMHHTLLHTPLSSECNMTASFSFPFPIQITWQSWSGMKRLGDVGWYELKCQ